MAKDKDAPKRPDILPDPPPDQVENPPLTVTIDMNVWQLHDVKAKLHSAFGGIGISGVPE